MKKQNICIIGGGLTGLIASYILSRSNVNIDLITGNFSKNFRSLRTTAISESNYKYLKNMNIFDSLKPLLWPCNKIELYDGKNNFENEKIFDFNQNNNKNILYMMKNEKVTKIIKNKIIKKKNIFIKPNIQINKVATINEKEFLKYNLIINCTGSNSTLTKMFLKDRYFHHNYDQISIVTYIRHSPIKNDIARQFFLNEGPLAFLPVSNKETSIIWSVDKKILKEKNLKEKFQKLTRNIYKNVKYSKKIEYNDLSFHLGRICFRNRMLIFGNALHTVHPIAGQGLNMMLRDLCKLQNVIEKQIALGLDIGSSTLVTDFSDEIKSNNFVYSTGIDFLEKIFSVKNLTFKNFRNYYLKKINNKQNFKFFFINLADKGII